ncbi:MAG: hypothetical protein U0625_13310 [Phycisphaerales bacterium]
MKTLTKTSLLTALALAGGLAASASASISNANYVSQPGLEGLGTFSAYVTYSYTSGTTASLSILLTNTSALANGGYITAIAVNPVGANSASFVSCTDANFDGLGSGVSASPFGTFKTGASTSSSWLGGGAPQSGLAVGESATFTFLLTGSAGDLAAQSAATVLTRNDGKGMAIRFRGFENGGSDKVLGGGGSNIPGPAALAGLAMLGLVPSRRRR